MASSSNSLPVSEGGTKQIQHIFLSYLGETGIEKFSSIDSYECLCDYIVGKWELLIKGRFSILYSLPDKEKCILSNEEEFETMCYLVKRFGLYYIDMTIKDNVRVSTSNECRSESTENSVESSLDVFKSNRILLNDWKTLIKGVGQVFRGGISEARDKVTKFCISNGYKFKYKRNTSNNVKLLCVNNQTRNSKWKIAVAAIKHSDNAQVIKYEPTHTCDDIMLQHNDGRLSSEVVVGVIQESARENIHMTPANVQEYIRIQYGFYISYKTAHNALAKANSKEFGDVTLSYDQLRPYFEKLKECDPNSTVKLDYVRSTGHFRRCFISFGASLHAFEHCRPLIFLDGTFLTGKYKDHLLAATTKDGNNGLYNIAFAIVGSENNDNWSWFIKHLRPIIDDRIITFISDRCIGISKGVEEHFRLCHHAYFVLHLVGNLKHKLSGVRDQRKQMIFLFNQMAYARTKKEYDDAFKKAIEEGGNKMKEFMDNLSFEKFSCAHFKGNRYVEMTSNAVESFNAQIKKFKHLPVTQLIDQIRKMLMEQIYNRRTEGSCWNSELCPNVMIKYNRSVEASRTWTVLHSTSIVFEVLIPPSSFIVNISKYTCSCGGWQDDGFPCDHAVAVLLKAQEDHYNFIDKCFHTKNYMKCYSYSIPPFDRTEMPEPGPEDEAILPPEVRRPPGRPKKKRIPSQGENERKKKKCGRCHQLGYHNSRTCKEPI